MMVSHYVIGLTNEQVSSAKCGLLDDTKPCVDKLAIDQLNDKGVVNHSCTVMTSLSAFRSIIKRSDSLMAPF